MSVNGEDKQVDLLDKLGGYIKKDHRQEEPINSEKVKSIPRKRDAF